jgi:hypothetical protein
MRIVPCQLCFLFLRRKIFTLTNDFSLNKNTCEKSVLDSVHHVIIPDENVISDCSKYFPNANELTVCDQRTARARRSETDNIDSVIPLVQLTKLTIDYKHRPFSKVIDLLHCTPNLHTLVLNRLSLVATDYFPLQQSEKFRLVSNQNRIKNVTVLFDYSLDNIKLIANLCPKLQQLSICLPDHYEPTVRFLLSESNRIIPHLCSICVLNVNFGWSEKLKTLIESEKSRGNYSVKVIAQTFFVWW